VKRRVAITGLGAVSPLGVGLPALMDGLERGASGIVRVPALAAVDGLRCQLAGLVPAFEAPDLPRRHRRSMSPMSVFAYLACREALAMAGLEVESARDSLCLILGSTVGSPQTLEAFFADYLPARSLSAIKSTTFFKAMGHAAAANVSQALGLAGPLLAPTAACATGCLAVGLAYDLIAGGRQEMILAGGTDEFHPLVPATFDIMNAASVGFNHSPDQAPRPFDRRRDGVVCAEGAGVLLLEAMDAALARGAKVLAEITGYASSADVSHIAHPEAAAIERCLRLALRDAAVAPGEVDYVNMHATGTLSGDVAEARAVASVFGPDVPVSSLKGHLGHTMAASGALELAASVEMARRGRLAPTRNLSDVDPDCAGLAHLQEPACRAVSTVVKNNFALGGVNAVIVFRSGA